MSLLLAASRSQGSGILTFCVGQLLPGVIEIVARAAEDNYSMQDPRYRSLDEVLKAFVAVLLHVAVDRREFCSLLSFSAIEAGVLTSARKSFATAGTQSMSILLPTLNLLLSTSSTPTRPVHSLALNYVLQLAAAHSSHFKEATAALPEAGRKLLEESIRATVKGPGGAGTRGGAGGAQTGGEAPKIELKLF